MKVSLLIVLNSGTIQVGLSGVVLGTYTTQGQPTAKGRPIAVPGLQAFKDPTSLREHLNALTTLLPDLTLAYDSFMFMGEPDAPMMLYHKGVEQGLATAQATNPAPALASIVEDLITRSSRESTLTTQEMVEKLIPNGDFAAAPFQNLVQIKEHILAQLPEDERKIFTQIEAALVTG